MQLLNAFEKAISQCKDDFYLTGDVLLVQKIPAPEHSKEVTGPNGQKTQIFLAGGAEKKIDGLDMNLPMFVRVLAVGPGFYDPEDEAKSIGCECEVGDIILIGRMSVNWFSVFGSLISTATAEIGITRESEVRMRFKGQMGYDKFFKALNLHAQEKTLQLSAQDCDSVTQHPSRLA